MKPVTCFVFFVSAVCACAQDAKSLLTSAPPAVEKALRERVTAFYQCFVDQKYRQADQFVAEDSKDAFFAQEKQKMRDYEVIKIDWADGFGKAVVVTSVGTQIRIRGNAMDTKAPLATRWKIEDGKWMYYVDPSMGKATPVGIMKAGPGNNKGTVNIEQMIRDPNVILNQIKVSKESVDLKGFEPSTDTLTITNGMPGSVQLTFHTESIAGLTWKLDKPDLNAGETATLVVAYAPKDASAKPILNATLRIEPFGKVLPMKVVFDIPEAQKKQLPKQP